MQSNQNQSKFQREMLQRLIKEQKVLQIQTLIKTHNKLTIKPDSNSVLTLITKLGIKDINNRKRIGKRKKKMSFYYLEYRNKREN